MPHKIIGTVTDHEGKELKLLAGSEYRSCLLPLDYLPSRDYSARWGYRVAPHQGLVNLLNRFSTNYETVLDGLNFLRPRFAQIPAAFCPPHAGWEGGPMNALDLALIYYFTIRSKPKRYIEIGSGISTSFARRAIDDERLATKLISIDPQPRAEIDAICHQVVREGLETLPELSIFEQLEAGDIVFMDGSHRSFMNSDVTVFMLDIVPSLKPGVLIHFHDIFLPYDYPRMFDDWYWNEQYILAAYLLGSSENVEILFPANYVAHSPQYRDKLSRLPTQHTSEGPWLGGGSFWFTRR